MNHPITLLAGRHAIEVIRDGGLTPESIRIVSGAAGGPKWIVLNHLDRYLFSSWLTDLPHPVHLVGSSIATYRYAAVMQPNPATAIERFLDAYIHQRYTDDPTPEEVTATARDILDTYLPDAAMDDVLNHPFLRFNALAVRSKGLTASENRLAQTAALAGVALTNLVSRNGLKLFFERTLFHDPRDLPPFYGMNDFPTRRIPVSRDNLKEVILASGSIPMVMSGIRDIPGSDGGVFRDGGVIDYHLDIPYNSGDGIVLYPHFTDRIIPGWLDKHLSWRKPDADHMKSVLLVAPSKDFIASLPYGKIPDRKDFIRFKHRDTERIDYWKRVSDRCRALSDAFHDAVDSGRIKTLVKPMPGQYGNE